MITIKLEVEEKYTELSGSEKVEKIRTIERSLDAKLNYFATKVASEYYDKLNKEISEESGTNPGLSLANTYSLLLDNPSPEVIVELMWIMFKHPKNGGLNFEQCEDYVNAITEDDSAYDELVEGFLIVMEDSGFFMRSVNKSMDQIRDTVIPELEKELKEEQDKGKTAMHLVSYLSKLNEISTVAEARNSQRKLRMQTDPKLALI